MRDYELYHHGIKGQKWGVRRTAIELGHRVANAGSKAGKALYEGAKVAGKAVGREAAKAGKAVGRGAAKAGKAAKKAAVTKAKQTIKETKEKNYYKKLHRKKLSQMTDKEIADLTKRVKKEAELKSEKYELRAQNARKFYNTVAKQPVNTFFSSYTSAVIKKAFDDKKDTSSSDDKDKTKDKTVESPEPVITFETKSSRSRRKRPERGTANSFNNPIIIRHEGR